jgi:aminoglycoside 6'-N-acetyltransferase
MAGRTRLTGERVVLEPLVPEHRDALRAIHQTDGVLYWWGEMEPDFPDDEPTSTRYAITVDGAVAGMIQSWEEPEPHARHAGIDIFVDPDRHGEGIGTDAIRTLVDHLVDGEGHHRITIDPELANTAAIRCYEKVGFEPVGVMKAAFFIRGAWQDELLMNLVRHRVSTSP